MSVNAHAPYGCSSAYRWTECGLSVRLIQQVPLPPTGPAAAAGTLMHAGYERLLLGLGGFTASELAALDECSVSSQRASAIVCQAVDATHTLFGQYDIDQYATEVRVDPGSRIGRGDYWGTSDVVAVSARRRALMVVDLKTGRGAVDPTENLQLLSYALGALEVIDFIPQRVVLGIVQPPLRGNQPLVWETTHQVLLAFERYIAQRIAAAEAPDAQPAPSEASCQWCPARSICPAHLNEGGAP